MTARPIETLDVRCRRDWRKWLKEHHDREREVWLVFHKRHTDVSSIEYDAAVEEALCFGWIDSIVRRLDEDRYARKFTPRRADSRWSTANRRRYATLRERGLLEPAGLRMGPTDRVGDAPRPPASAIPSYIERAFRTDPLAWRHFEALAPSYRRAYIAWIDSAKREATRKTRIAEALELLAAGKKLGLK